MTETTKTPAKKASGKPPAANATKPQGLLRSSAIYSALTLVSRFIGLARDLVITAKLGGSGNIAADAYYTALTFPNLFRRIFAEGAFAAAFVPDYSEAPGRRGRGGGRQVRGRRAGDHGRGDDRDHHRSASSPCPG